MTLTNKEIINIYPILSKLKNGGKSFPVKVAYAIARNLKTLRGIVEDVDPLRLSILEKYGEIQEDNNTYLIPPENKDIVVKELDDLDSVENDIKVYTIKLEQLDGYDLSVEEMEAIDFMIEESEE